MQRNEAKYLPLSVLNNRKELEEKLEQGYRLDLKLIYDFDRFIDPTHWDLIYQYSAFPDGLSLATLKFLLFLNGHCIDLNDFLLIDKSKELSEAKFKADVNIEGHPACESPMKMVAVHHKNIFWTKMLITAGAKERPISKLFPGIHEDQFTGLDLLDMHHFKERITKHFTGNYSADLRRDIKTQSAIAELFLTNPNEQLAIEMQKLTDKQLFPFFSWVAFNNKFALLNTRPFTELFVTHPKAAALSMETAVVFGSYEYAKDGIIASGVNCLRRMLSIAAATCDNEMLTVILNALDNFKVTLKQIAHDSANSVSGSVDDAPLFWAIRCGNPGAVDAFLQNGKGMDANGYVDNVTGEGYLHLAARVGNLISVEHLIAAGAHLESTNFSKRTPLHEAIFANKWNVAKSLVEKHNANIYATDIEGKTPLDYINDEAEKNKLIALAKEPSSEEKSQAPLLTNGFNQFTKFKLMVELPKIEKQDANMQPLLKHM